MPSYNSTARVPFAKGGKVDGAKKKPTEKPLKGKFKRKKGHKPGSYSYWQQTVQTPKFKKGGKADKDWIQGVNKSIKKRGTKGVCTGKKFGGASCPPGSKRYNLAKTFKKMARNRKKK